jgi:SAM-dependent methyltransferase
MPYGSILSRLSQIELSTADEKSFTIRNNALTRLGFRFLGIPHLGWRTRAGIIMAEMKKAPKTARVLDAGCGYGIYSLMLGKRGFSVDAIDIDSDRVAGLRRSLSELPEAQKHVRTHVGSLTALPFADGSFDRIICPEVVEHIADDQAALRELARVLAPGGKLIFTVPAWSKWNEGFYKNFLHERVGYRPAELSDTFERLGLATEKLDLYEYALGMRIFMFYNSLRSKALMGLLFYPCFWLHRLDHLLKIGEPSYLALIAVKTVNLSTVPVGL